jgi:hypothetical protein
MSLLQTEIATQHEVALTMLMLLGHGRIKDATACFAKEFRFQDRGLGLEFNDRERLGEFFQKSRELYPDSIVAGSDEVLRHACLTFPAIATTAPAPAVVHRLVPSFDWKLSTEPSRT